MRKKRAYIILFCLAAAFAVASCGYSLHTAKDYRVSDVRIGKIENLSREPRLEDILKSALADELQKQGIRLDGSSPNEIRGELTEFSLLGVSERGEIFNAYEVRINGNFTLMAADGTETRLKGASPFITTFPAQADLSTVFAGREAAVRRAIADLSTELVSRIVYK